MKLKHQRQDFYQKTQIPAFSLVETIISMVIVTIAFSGGVMLFINVVQNEQLTAQTEASICLENLMTKTKEVSGYLDETYKEKAFVVKKKITYYGSGKETFQLSLQAENYEGRLLLELREVIYCPAKIK